MITPSYEEPGDGLHEGRDFKSATPLIFIAGPLESSGSMLRNVSDACAAGAQIMDIGAIPVIPHLSAYADALYPRERAAWLRLGLALLERCDACYRVPGSSVGADAEVDRAGQLRIPIFTTMPAIVDWMAARTLPREPAPCQAPSPSPQSPTPTGAPSAVRSPVGGAPSSKRRPSGIIW